MQTHEPRNRTCPACGETRFRRAANVVDHVEMGHCRACGDNGRRMVEQFARKHTNSYQPAICDDGSYNRQSDRPYCKECNKFFNSVSALMNHNDSKHPRRQQMRLSLGW